MDWFKQNPFLGILAAATGAAVLASGYFLFDSHSRYESATQEFEELASTLQRLQNNKPFPNEENVRRSREESDSARAMLEEIGRNLEVEVPATTPQGFQDQLRQHVNEITARAEANGVVLGEGFYLGFEAYETQPPAPAAASQLALQLRSISAVADLLVDAKVREITAIKRAPLPVELPAEPATDERRGRDSGGDAGSPDGGLPDLVLAPFDLTFVADQTALRAAFNRLLETEPPVFVRLVGLTNSAPEAPAKAGAADEATAGEIKPVLGQETLLVNLRLAAISGGPAETK
ncbi:MAG: hypothetical protein WEC73_00295 [Chthoniobacterales bacterium]